MHKIPFIIKLTQWEHWPTIFYYFPLLPFFLMRALKAGNLTHFLIANPGILYSGYGSESKHKTLELLPSEFRPISLLISKNEAIDLVMDRLKNLQLIYPLIIKPDIGFRGYLVEKINSEEELLCYLRKVGETVIVQEFIPFEQELGIFYHRFPGEVKGKITSVTIKNSFR